jgi:16S rRNA (guanine527-N7)-methyltransferase
MTLVSALELLDREAAQLGVSRETSERLRIVLVTLFEWQPRINLVANSTLRHVWERHVVDSLQLLALAPRATAWLDIGSGGGFPGLVVASQLAEVPEAGVTLVESNAKKCAFLREVTRKAGLPVRVIPERIERGLERLGRFDVVSARALAPLDELLRMTSGLLKTGTLGLFPKGAEVERELTQAAKSWRFSVERHPSHLDRAGCILAVRGAEAISPFSRD